MCCKPQAYIKFLKDLQHFSARGQFLNLSHSCNLDQLADHALHVQYPKLGLSLLGSPGETKRPFNPHRVLLGTFSIVFNQFSWVNFPEVKSVIRENATSPREISYLPW